MVLFGLPASDASNNLTEQREILTRQLADIVKVHFTHDCCMKKYLLKFIWNVLEQH